MNRGAIRISHDYLKLHWGEERTEISLPRRIERTIPVSQSVTRPGPGEVRTVILGVDEQGAFALHPMHVVAFTEDIRALALDVTVQSTGRIPRSFKAVFWSGGEPVPAELTDAGVVIL